MSASLTPPDSNHGYDINDNRGYVMWIVIGILTPVTTAVVTLRFYSRHFLSNQGLAADDWISGFSMVCWLFRRGWRSTSCDGSLI